MRAKWSPNIEGGEVVLRPLEPSDASAWFEYVSLPQVMQHTSSNVRVIEDLRPMFERFASEDPGSPVHFAICGTEGQLVGTIGFHTISHVNRTAELTYDVRPSSWGHGIATACCKGAIAWGFSACGFVRVQATVLQANVASIRVLEKGGFHREGQLRNFRMVRGEPRDFLLYATVPTNVPHAVV